MKESQQIKPNLLEVAKKQMAKFIKKINVPSEINENEKDYYHVVIVEANFDKTKLEATYKSRVQVYNNRSWLAVKDRLKQIGHTNVYVIHDPTIKAGASSAKNGNDNRQRLIDRAKELGYEGALNVKNSVFEEFIKNAEANGEIATGNNNE